MNKRIRNLIGSLIWLTILIVTSCNNSKAQVVSLSELQPTVIEKNGAEIFQYWELKNGEYLWDTNFVQPVNLKLYKDSLNLAIGKDTFELTIQRLAFQDISYKSIKTNNGDSVNAQLIHSKTLGKNKTNKLFGGAIIGISNKPVSNVESSDRISWIHNG